MAILPKDHFFAKIDQLGLALTYDDVRLRAGYSDVLPDQVSTASWFSRHVPLKVPIVSAAMDTVTTSGMAIAMAKTGGLGIIHKNMSIEDQASEVSRVKYHMNGFIDRPICVSDTEPVADVLERRVAKGYDFHSFPVTNAAGQLVGIVTRDDFDFCLDPTRRIADIMTRDVITAPEGTTLADAYAIMQRQKKKLLPIINAGRTIVGLYVFSDLRRIQEGNHDTYNTDANGQLYVGAAVGVGEAALERAAELARKKVDVLVIDTAHGDTASVVATLQALKRSFSNIDVVVGNVSQPDAVTRLIAAGADGVKIGQGPGSICTTRIIAGIGTPQVTAVYYAARAAEGAGVPICADGGINYSGDITIAIGAGAHSVMLGSLLAGTDESPGDIVYYQNRQWKTYRGMGSLQAMQDNAGSRERYGQRAAEKSRLVPEGVEGLVAYKGSVAALMTQYVGGLSRGMGYVGASTIEDLRTKADFYRISPAGQQESHPHNIEITSEAPNYSRKS